MQTSDSVQNLMPALLAVHQEMPEIKKRRTARVPTKKGGSYEYSYADITDILDAMRPVLAKHELMVSQDTESVQGGLSIKTRLWHKSGEWVESAPIIMPANTQDAQSIGSASTYGRRYSLAALLGIAADDDDDGSGARQNGENKAKQNGHAKRQEPNWGSDKAARQTIFWALQQAGHRGQAAGNQVSEWLSQLGKSQFDETTADERRHFYLYLCGEEASPVLQVDANGEEVIEPEAQEA